MVLERGVTGMLNEECLIAVSSFFYIVADFEEII
jgi:hypothetical protein